MIIRRRLPEMHFGARATNMYFGCRSVTALLQLISWHGRVQSVLICAMRTCVWPVLAHVDRGSGAQIESPALALALCHRNWHGRIALLPTRIHDSFLQGKHVRIT